MDFRDELEFLLRFSKQTPTNSLSKPLSIFYLVYDLYLIMLKYSFLDIN